MVHIGQRQQQQQPVECQPLTGYGCNHASSSFPPGGPKQQGVPNSCRFVAAAAAAANGDHFVRYYNLLNHCGSANTAQAGLDVRN